MRTTESTGRRKGVTSPELWIRCEGLCCMCGNPPRFPSSLLPWENEELPCIIATEPILGNSVQDSLSAPDQQTLGDEAIRQGYQPVDLSEWFPFIEGYAMVGSRYQAAADLTRKMLGDSPEALVPLSCLWNRVQQDGAGNSPELTGTLRDLRSKLLLVDALR